MANTYTTLKGQSLLDVAVQVYGSTEGVRWLLVDNRLPEKIVFDQNLERYVALDRPGWEWAGTTLEQLLAMYQGYGPAWVPPTGFRLRIRDGATTDANTRRYLESYGPIATAP